MHSIELQQATSAMKAAASDSEQKRDSARCRILHRQATPACISLVRICLVETHFEWLANRARMATVG
jgi:hypothetical protein